MYSQKTIKRFKNPKFSGEIKKYSGKGKVGNVQCGDIMEVYIKVKDDIIKDVKFKTYGCIAAIASSDALCEMIKGKTLDQALKLKEQDIVVHLGGLPPIKHHCSVLGVQALREAINDFKKKNKR